MHIDLPEEPNVSTHYLVLMWLRMLNPVLNMDCSASESLLLDKDSLTLLLTYQHEWDCNSLSAIIESCSGLLLRDSILGHKVVFFLFC
jgi:hypothetical protein